MYKVFVVVVLSFCMSHKNHVFIFWNFFLRGYCLGDTHLFSRVDLVRRLGIKKNTPHYRLSHGDLFGAQSLKGLDLHDIEFGDPLISLTLGLVTLSGDFDSDFERYLANPVAPQVAIQ